MSEMRQNDTECGMHESSRSGWQREWMMYRDEDQFVWGQKVKLALIAIIGTILLIARFVRGHW